MSVRRNTFTPSSCGAVPERRERLAQRQRLRDVLVTVRVDRPVRGVVERQVLDEPGERDGVVAVRERVADEQVEVVVRVRERRLVDVRRLRQEHVGEAPSTRASSRCPLPLRRVGRRPPTAPRSTIRNGSREVTSSPRCSVDRTARAHRAPRGRRPRAPRRSRSRPRSQRRGVAGEPVGLVVGVARAGDEVRDAAPPVRGVGCGIRELFEGDVEPSVRGRRRAEARWRHGGGRRDDRRGLHPAAAGSALMPSAPPTPTPTPAPRARSATTATAARQAGLRAIVTAGRVTRRLVAGPRPAGRLPEPRPVPLIRR